MRFLVLVLLGEDDDEASDFAPRVVVVSPVEEACPVEVS